MADPVTAGIMLATTAASAGLSAYGAQQSGEAQQRMYQYQAGVAKVNQDIAQRNADWERAAGEVEAQQEGMKGRFEVGEIKVAQAASGLDVSSGSALATRQSQQEITSYNEYMARKNAEKRAYGYQVQAVQEDAQGKLGVMAGQQSSTAGTIGMYSSLLGGASSVSSKYLQGKQYGLWGGSSGSLSGGMGLSSSGTGSLY